MTWGKFFLGGLVCAVPLMGIAFLWSQDEPSQVDSPWDRVPSRLSHTDHANLVTGPLPDGPSATRMCLTCHPDAAQDLMQTSHWTWASQKVQLPGREEVMRVGKRNLINNFCIAAGPNMEACSACHAGYGWVDNSFNFSEEQNVDCLICHEQTGTYQKGLGGLPKPEVDLLAVAKSVGVPTRRNCGECHFKGGGGDAVKHGDLDGSMYMPSHRVDQHMGDLDLRCQDCHRTEKHRIPGCAMSVCIDRPLRVYCTDCHEERPHGNERLDAHTKNVSCQACHIPRIAIDAPTKMKWNWSDAGQDGREDDPHHYLKIKGSFVYAQNVRPEYYWYNGRAFRYLTGDKINPGEVVDINRPLGGPDDPEAKIWPFKVHRGNQPYDAKYNHLLTPKTFGDGGYWTEFDWDKAFRLGAESTGLPYSGEFGFVDTRMYWPISHMAQASERALQCQDCHSEGGIMDWEQLGFHGDPAYEGGRRKIGHLEMHVAEGRNHE